ncbi:MAG: PDZ domain-containing protein [Proteobacteria bacterium]|nr:PDZ domain-containing protein [Pseudomonadota bacterium]
MDSKIRIAVRVVIAALLILVAVCLARGIGNIVSKKVVSLTPYDVKVLDEVEYKAEKVDVGAMEMIVYNRNLFNQKGGQEEAEPEPEAVEQTETEEPVVDEIAMDGTHPVLTDLRIKLMGTQVASDRSYSLALIMPLEGGNDARMQYLKEGDVVLSEAKILAIVRNRIYMERTTQNNRLEYIDTRTTEEDLAEAKKNLEKAAEKEKAAVAAAEKEKEKAAAAAAAAAAPASGELVKKVGNDTYEVSGEAVAMIKKNPNALKNNPQYGALPKVTPVYKGGNIGGFRLMGVESGSIYAKLGLKSGDTINDVNGQAIEGAQQAMALLDALKPGQDVKLKINRAGAEKVLTFQVK